MISVHSFPLRLLLATALFLSTPLSGASQTPSISEVSQIRWEGEIALWKRKACRPNQECGLPETIATPLHMVAEFTRPVTPGAHLVSDQAYVFNNWTAAVSIYWVNPKPVEATSSTPAVTSSGTSSGSTSNSAPPYIVTQIRLSEKVLGVVVECSRYDGPSELSFLPPGSCAGRDGAMLYGVSVMSPRTQPPGQ